MDRNVIKINGIPVYDALVEGDGTGMVRISLVDTPAVNSDFIALRAQEEKQPAQQLFAVEDEEKRLVFGVVMRADYPIYRRDRKGGEEVEYYVIYRADTIRTMAEKYLAENRQNDVNLMHKGGTEVEGVQMVQWFIKDSGRGLVPGGFEDIADGSLFAEFHVSNDDVWDEIKAGTYKGFSLEGYFDMVPETDRAQVQEDVRKAGRFARISKSIRDMKIHDIKAALLRVLSQFGSVTTDRGVLVWDGTEDLKAGDSVSVEAEDGSTSPAEDGEYKTADNKTIIVTDGKVAEIKDPEAEVDSDEEDGGRRDTDRGTLFWDGDDDLKAGTPVYVEEDGKRVTAPDGDYITADDKIITVKDGKVERISDNKAEVAARRMCARLAKTYSEREMAIYKALAGSGLQYYYILEASDDHAVVEAYGDDYSGKYFRYTLSFAKDGTVTLGERTEVKPVYVPLSTDVDALFDENTQMRAELEQLRAQPLAKPAHTAVQASVARTGDAGLDRLAAIMSA